MISVQHAYDRQWERLGRHATSDASAAWLAVALLSPVIGLIVRVALLQRYYLVPDGDQSVLGLMARHVLQGERPVFYWGQVYTGSGEAYLTAGLFRLFGASNLVLHVVPLAASELFCLLTGLLAYRLYGLRLAALTCAFLGLGPMFLVDWSFWAGSGYLEAMALGTAALLLVLPGRPEQSRTDWRRVGFAFFLLGLGFWAQPTALYYVAAVAVALSGSIVRSVRMPRRWPGLAALVLVAGAAFCLGSLPLVVYNVQHDWATISFVTARTTHLAFFTVLSRLVLWAGPVLLGFMPPTSDQAYYSQFRQDHLTLYVPALILLVLLLVFGLSRWRLLVDCLRGIGTARQRADAPLLILGLLVVAGYLGTGWGGEQWAGTQPRYLLPAYSTLPLVLRATLPLGPAAWHWLVAVAVLICVIGVDASVNTSTFARRDLAPLAKVLEDRGVRAVYGDYWLVYPLMFASDEHIVGVSVGDDLSKGVISNRYSPYLRTAAATPAFAWIASAGSARERSIRACLARLHSQYAIIRWQDQIVFAHPTARAYPWWNGGQCKP